MNAQAKARKPKRDLNQLAASIVAEAIEDAPPPEEPDVPSEEPEPEDDGKNPAAVALGRLGGKKGGPARAAKLSAKRRKAIAKKAAQARWGNRNES
ncbi:MAG: hypothetical protein PHU25_15925 [Deltaproteobacteria bacterium]|nr:hypothetical protein [Deltaproteobacteria bacterium]